jgi:hypothetical protein
MILWQLLTQFNPVMPALPKSTHFDIADACRDIPESTREDLFYRVLARGYDRQTIVGRATTKRMAIKETSGSRY